VVAFTFDCSAANMPDVALTNQANNCPKDTMKNLGRISILGSIPLRAMLAVVFLVMSAAQPGLFANANAAGLHGDTGLSPGIENPVHEAGDHEHGHVHDASADHEGQEGGHHGSSTSAGKGCEVHCAPAHAVPVACPEIAPVISRCFPPAVATSLPLGEYAALIKPPQHLN
jgi:hypothetical protein